MRNVDPKGVVGEVVGFNPGWSSSKTVRAVICGVSKTTVSIIINDERRTFNRSNWRERGHSQSRYAAFIVSEEMLELNRAQDSVTQKERTIRTTLAQKVDDLRDALRYAQSADRYYDYAETLREMAEMAKAAGAELLVDEANARQAREAVYGKRAA